MEEEFETVDAGASLTFPMEAGQIKKGGYMMIKDRPCRVISVSTSKTGKHGHAKAHFVAVDIFNGKKVEDVVPTTHTVPVPNVQRTEFQLLDISEDDFCTLLDNDGNVREDLELPRHPETLAPSIRKSFSSDSDKSIHLSVLSACEIDQIIDFKESN